MKPACITPVVLHTTAIGQTITRKFKTSCNGGSVGKSYSHAHEG